MKPEWKDFLKDAGAEIDEDSECVVSFGNPQQEQRVVHTGLIICDLSHQGLISAYGEDAAGFLQGQLTNDVRDVSEHHSQLSAYCTPKGRMLANFRIFKRENTFYLRLPREQLESTLNRLSMFTLMARVTLKDSSDSLVPPSPTCRARRTTWYRWTAIASFASQAPMIASKSTANWSQ